MENGWREQAKPKKSFKNLFRRRSQGSADTATPPIPVSNPLTPIGYGTNGNGIRRSGTLAKINQRNHKRPRCSKQPKKTQAKFKNNNLPVESEPTKMDESSKGGNSKTNPAHELARKSKEAAALKHLRKMNKQAALNRKLLYSSSPKNKSYNTIGKNKVKLTPTLEIKNIDSDSQRNDPKWNLCIIKRQWFGSRQSIEILKKFCSNWQPLLFLPT